MTHKSFSRDPHVKELEKYSPLIFTLQQGGDGAAGLGSWVRGNVVVEHHLGGEVILVIFRMYSIWKAGLLLGTKRKRETPRTLAKMANWISEIMIYVAVWKTRIWKCIQKYWFVTSARTISFLGKSASWYRRALFWGWQTNLEITGMSLKHTIMYHMMREDIS